MNNYYLDSVFGNYEDLVAATSLLNQTNLPLSQLLIDRPMPVNAVGMSAVLENLSALAMPTKIRAAKDEDEEIDEDFGDDFEDDFEDDYDDEDFEDDDFEDDDFEDFDDEDFDDSEFYDDDFDFDDDDEFDDDFDEEGGSWDDSF